MRPRLALALITASLTALAGAQSVHAAFFPAQAIDGPSVDVVSFGGIDVAADGTGAVAYVKKTGGDNHVFAATLANGVWSAPQRVDVGSTEASHLPRVAVGNGGRVAIVYIQEKPGADLSLAAVVKPSSGAPFGAPTPLLDPAGGTGLDDPAVDMNPAGVAYAVVTDSTAVDQVVGFRLAGNAWAPLASSLNQDATKDAANQGNGPESAIAVDGAGNGVAFFNQVDGGGGRNGWVRRVNGVTPGAPIQWDVPTFQGAAKASGDIHAIMLDLDVAADGTAVAIGREDFVDGAFNRPRAIARRLTGNTLGPALAADGLTFPLAVPDGGEHPRVDLAANGNGLVSADRQLTNGATGGLISPSGISGLTNLNTAGTEDYQQPKPAYGDNGTGLVAAGRAVSSDVVARRWNGSAFEAQTVVSNPAFGTATWSFQKQTGASSAGDVAVGFVQGAAATTRIVVGGFDSPPTAPTGTTSEKLMRDATPTLSWTAASDLWGGVESYRLIVDGKQVGTATGLSFTTPKLASKTHSWSVQAVDRRGQATAGATRALRIDVRKPKASIRFKGVKRVGRKVKVIVTARDASGIKRITVKFGDRKQKSKTRRIKRKSTFAHRYKQAKRFTVRATVVDKAGNRKTVRKKLRIAPR